MRSPVPPGIFHAFSKKALSRVAFGKTGHSPVLAWLLGGNSLEVKYDACHFLPIVVFLLLTESMRL